MACRIFLFIILLHYGACWEKSQFKIASKLPKDCGRASAFSTENIYENWGFWPWLGMLSYEGWGKTSIKCNAILIHPQIAVTALECVKFNRKENLTEILFISFSSPGLPNYQNIPVSDLDFTGDNYNNPKSLVLLKLSYPVVISSRVQPICIWEENHDYSGQLNAQVGLVVGADLDNLYSFSELRVYQAPVRIVNEEKCKSRDVSNSASSDGPDLCILYYREPINCHGFGSMLMIPRLSDTGAFVWYLRSIVTTRNWICNNVIYTKTFDIAEVRPWIESHFQPSIETKCGRKASVHIPLITYGTRTMRGDWPWHVALYLEINSEQVYRCGGSLISTKYVLTAGHCVVANSEILEGKLSVKLGKQSLSAVEEGSQDVKVSAVILHDEYTDKLRNDIALLRLERQVIFNDYIQPVCLWTNEKLKKEHVFNREAKVPGWGTDENDALTDSLYVTSIPIVDDAYCLQTHSVFYSLFLTENTFCAGRPRTNASSVCNGDSGGGLVLPEVQDDLETTWFLRGIVSTTVRRHDKNICDLEYYAVFTDVAKYLKWISLNTAI